MQEGLKLQLLREVNRRLKSTLPEASIEIVSLPGLPSVRLGLKKAGARKVLACDIDPDALKATELNCHINEVEVSLIDNLDEIVEPVSLMFMADVLYDKNNFALIEVALSRAEALIIADSRINNLGDKRFKIFDKMEMLTIPNLGEFDEYKEVTFYSSKKIYL